MLRNQIGEEPPERASLCSPILSLPPAAAEGPHPSWRLAWKFAQVIFWALASASVKSTTSSATSMFNHPQPGPQHTGSTEPLGDSRKVLCLSTRVCQHRGVSEGSTYTFPCLARSFHLMHFLFAHVFKWFINKAPTFLGLAASTLTEADNGRIYNS